MSDYPDAERTIRFTFFKSLTDTTVQPRELPWQQFCKRLTSIRRGRTGRPDRLLAHRVSTRRDRARQRGCACDDDARP